MLVGPQGYLLTKASETANVDTARFQSGVSVAAKRLQVDTDLDLALFRINVPKVPSVDWNFSVRPEMGQIAIAIDVKRTPKVGVVATKLRAIPKTGAALGVAMADGFRGSATDGAHIGEILDDSPAKRAGLKGGDVVIAVNGRETRNFDALREVISSLNPDDTALIKIRRNDDIIAIPVTLGHKAVIEREDRNQKMSGRTSDRRTGFERVIQHDIPIHADSLGGPLLNLSGEVIGINIARSDRVTTYAIPNKLARASAQKMIQDTLRGISNSGTSSD